MIDWIFAWWDDADWPKRLMSLGLVITIVVLVLARLGLPANALGGVLLVASGVLAAGYLLEAYAFTKRALETLPGKVIAAILATCLGAIAAGLANRVINESTGLNPSELDFAVTFLAPLAAGLMLTALTVVVSVIGLLCFLARSAATAVFGWFRPDRTKEADAIERETLRFSGVLGLLVLGTVVWAAAEQPYRMALGFAAHVFIYELEFYDNDPCAGSGERIRRLNDDVVVVAAASQGTVSYSRRLCPLVAPLAQ